MIGGNDRIIQTNNLTETENSINELTIIQNLNKGNELTFKQW